MKHVIVMSCAALLCAAPESASAQVRRPTRTGPPTLSTTTPTPPAAPILVAFALSLDSISGGPAPNQPNGKVTLSVAAPPGGLAVTLSSDSPAASVPASVPVAAGATEASFPLATTVVSTPTIVRITARAGTVTITDSLRVLLGVVSVVSEGWAAGSNNTQRVYRVTMSGLAPPNGLKLMASLVGGGHPSAGVCAPMPLFSYPIAVAAGANSGLLTITTDRSMLKQWYWEISYGHRKWPQPQLTVMPAHVGLITIPSTITGGTTGYGTVQTGGGSTVSAACVAQNPTWYNHEYTVYFSSSNTAVLQVPSSGLISPGQNQLSFAIVASAATTQQTATITASRRNNQGALVAVKQVTVTVTP